MTEQQKKPKAKRTCAHSLKTLQHVGIEMARCYRAVKRGDLNSSDGYRMVMILAALKSVLETSEIERKIAELEAAIAQRDNVAQFRPKAVS